MTDFTYLPADLWRDIAKFLSPKDHQALLLTSHFFQNNVASASILLQPLYNRLHVLDPSLPVLLPNDNVKATICFRKAAEKVLAFQNEEVKYLQGNSFRVSKMPNDCLEKLHLGSATLEQLEENSLVLDEINSRIIREKISENKSGKNLDLGLCGLTRFPTSLIAEHDNHIYFKELTSLNLLSNYIKKLDLSSLDNLIKLDCSVNHVLESVKMPNNVTQLLCSVNKLKFLDVSNCDKLEILFCDTNQLESIYFPKNGKIKTLQCQKNKIKILDLSRLMDLAYENLNFDFNPLEELYLEGCNPFVQQQFEAFQTKLLFNKLLKNFHDAEKKQEIIQTMGPRYSYANCLKYLGFMQTSTIASEQLISAVVSATSFLPSYSVSSKEVVMDLEQENNLSHSNPLKRERDEDDADSSERSVKKRK